MEPMPLQSDPIMNLDAAFETGFKKWFSGYRNFQPDYHNVTVAVGDMTLRNLDHRPGAPISLVQVSYRNDTKHDQTVGFSEERKTTASVGLSMTAGLKYRHALTGKIAVKKIFEIGETQELEFSLSATTRFDVAVEQKWAWNLPITIPARSTIHASAIVSTVYVEPELDIQVNIKSGKNDHPHDLPYNKVYTVAEFKNGDKWERRIYYTSLYGWLAGVPGFQWAGDQNSVRYDARAKLTGTRGLKLYIELKQEPIDGGLGSTRILEMDAAGQWLETAQPEAPAPTFEEAVAVLV
jgi:hypothetical protein